MDESHYRPFTELEAWKLSRKLKLQVYELLPSIPRDEKFELVQQLRRSVRSIPTNIAEGHGRFTFKDQYNFCVMARGSLMETLNHLIDAYDCKYISTEVLNTFKSQIDEVGRVLNGYMSFLKLRMKPNDQSTNQPIN